MQYVIHTPYQLGQALRSQRRTLSLTQRRAGEAVGLLPKTVSRLENGPERASIESLFRLASALGMELVLRPKDSPLEQEMDEPW